MQFSDDFGCTYEDGKIMYDGLKAVSRLAGNDYATVGEIIIIQRPK